MSAKAEAPTATCKTCKKPLRWDLPGQLCKDAERILAEGPGGTYTEADAHALQWAQKQQRDVEAYRATHQRGYLGAGDFCGKLCAATWAHSIMQAYKSGQLYLEWVEMKASPDTR